MDEQITNFQEYETFLNQKCKTLKTNFSYDMVEFINLENLLKDKHKLNIVFIYN